MIITDTGFWLALSNVDDEFHATAIVALRKLKEPLITTWPVLTETCHLLRIRIHVQAMLKFMQDFPAKPCMVWDVPEDLKPRIPVLMKKYQNLPMDLADASLVLLAEHLNDGRILSTDKRDFLSLRWKNRKPFKNLLRV